MPWYNSLNADVKRLRYNNCVVTNNLGNKDTRKFSIKTPTLIARGIKCLLENEWDEGVPTSEQMIRDCNLPLDAMYTFYQAGSVIVPELANINGNSYSTDGTGKHSDTRVKGDPGENK